MRDIRNFAKISISEEYFVRKNFASDGMSYCTECQRMGQKFDDTRLPTYGQKRSPLKT